MDMEMAVAIERMGSGVHVLGRVAQIVRAFQGRARCPQRAVGGRQNPHLSDIFGRWRRAGRSRRAEDSAPYHRSAHDARFSAIPHEIPCNLARRFPLYGVEADGLPLSVARRDKENRATES